MGFFKKLVSGLSKTRNNIVSGLNSIFHGFSKIDEDFYEELEETLIMGDIGVETTACLQSGRNRNKLFVPLLDKAGIPYERLIATDHVELVNQFGVKQAPTLVLAREEGFEKYKGVSDIKGWLMGKKQ